MRPALAAGLPRIDGVAEGPLVGVNLSLVASLVGTPLASSMQGAILFLENFNEEPYKVDRYLLQLRLSGALESAAGFLIGSFSDEASPAEVLSHYLRRLASRFSPAGPRATARRTGRCRWARGWCACGSADTARDLLVGGPWCRSC
jgi:muramoyltetrapeptide carboxypeptidase